MAIPISAKGGDASVSPARDYVPVTKANADLPNGACRALLVGTAGTANLMTVGGQTRNNVPLHEGENLLIVKRVLTGGTADNIWALY